MCFPTALATLRIFFFYLTLILSMLSVPHFILILKMVHHDLVNSYTENYIVYLQFDIFNWRHFGVSHNKTLTQPLEQYYFKIAEDSHIFKMTTTFIFCH